MHTKTFRADSALETLQLVQSELGASAIVVSMREVPVGPVWNPWNKSSVEIVAASPDEGVPQPLPQQLVTPTPVLRPAENKSGVEFIEEMPEIEWEAAPEKRLAELRAQPPPKLRLKLKSVTQDPPPASSEADSLKTALSTPVENQYVPPTLKKIQQ